jgi:hypothetical protein
MFEQAENPIIPETFNPAEVKSKYTFGKLKNKLALTMAGILTAGTVSLGEVKPANAGFIDDLFNSITQPIYDRTAEQFTQDFITAIPSSDAHYWKQNYGERKMRVVLDNWCSQEVTNALNIWPNAVPNVNSVWREEGNRINCYHRRFGQDGSQGDSIFRPF